MCDYSLQSVASRPAKVGDKLTTKNFHAGTRGFCSVEDPTVAVCVLPGTEMAFDNEVRGFRPGAAFSTVGVAGNSYDIFVWNDSGTIRATHSAWSEPAVEEVKQCKTAIFRQINKDKPHVHHDALEFPNGEQVLLTWLAEGQSATVLQLPAAPKTADEAKAQERLPVVA